MRKQTLPYLLLISLAACKVGPDYARPETTYPFQWPWSKTEAEKADAKTAPQKMVGDWWKQFNDPALDRMIDEGLKANNDLQVAAARVAQARAVLGLNEANLYPEIGLDVTANRTSRSAEALVAPNIPSNSRPFNTFTISPVLNYEVDLWGKLRRASESARAQLLATQANQDAVRLAVSSDIANGYFNLRALDAQILITLDTIKSREESLRYQQAQYKHGAVDGLTFHQAEAELAAGQASLPVLEQAKLQQETSLGILLGRNPKELVETPVERGHALDALPVPPFVPSDLPSTLVEQRPDIQTAEQALIASNAEIGIAKADYFPRLSLSALFGLSSSQTDTLLQSAAKTWTIAGGLTGPLIDFGRVSSNVDAAKARKDEAVQNYQQSIRLAFKDVLDAMGAQRNNAERVERQNTQQTARAEALRLAQLRYQAGYTPYLDVLDAQRTLYQAQLDHVTAQRDQLAASVALSKALGGGWQSPAIAGQPTASAEKADQAVSAPEDATKAVVASEPNQSGK